MIKKFKNMLLKDCHCDILNGAEKTIFYAETKRKKSFVEKVCEKTQCDMA